MRTLEEELSRLEALGCFPGIYYRGSGIWRAHINCAGNCWEEAQLPLEAIQKAILSWEGKDRPMDGMADE
jgi:hypothetical protein